MYTTRNRHLIGLALALGVAAAGGVAATEAAMDKDAFKAAQGRVEAQAKAQRKACDRFKGQARDLCQLEAKGREKVAKAQLEALHEPGPEAEKKLKFARADAGHDVAKQRCAALKGRARDTCKDRADHDHEAAIRLAKVEKVEEVRQLRARASDS